MTQRIRCRTLFDITVTGVRNHTNRTHLPFQDQAGQMVNDDRDWVRSRNQQRNWETINQILSLRTLPEDISLPSVDQQADKIWMFDFQVPDITSLHQGNDPLGCLKADCEAVPMILGLNETYQGPTGLNASDDDANIWFELVT